MTEHLLFKREEFGRLEAEWEGGSVPPILRKICLDLVRIRWEMLGVDTVMTSLFRSFKENRAAGGKSLTHVEWRAADFRAERSQLHSEESIREAMNEKWPTGIKGMPRIAPLDHGTGLHYHVQITRKEKGGQA